MKDTQARVIKFLQGERVYLRPIEKEDAEKLGFKREGTKKDALYYDYQYHDSIIMSILQDEFHINSSR